MGPFRVRNVSEEVVEKIEAYILGSITHFSKNRAVYEVMCKNTVELGRPQIKTWRMRILCWMPKATETYSEYVFLIALPLQQ